MRQQQGIADFGFLPMAAGHASARAVLVLAAACVTPGTALATNGYLQNGYGASQQAMAGAGYAFPLDALGIVQNPAAAALTGDDLVLQGDLFVPDRQAKIVGNGFGPDQTFSGNQGQAYLFPEAAVTWQFGHGIAAGLAVYANGGLITNYAQNPFARFGATGQAGVQLEQAVASPTIAWQFAPGQSVGIAVNGTYQTFKANGVGVFAPFSANPSNLTNNGLDHSEGVGVHVAYLGTVNRWLQVGLSWQSKSYNTAFHSYSGLFADQGGFDTPSTYGAGIVLRPNRRLAIPIDVQRIDYSDVNSVGNAFAELFTGKPLGSSNGPGFGWRDTTTFKIGVNYIVSPHWQVRGGYSYTAQPIATDNTFLNILAPGTIRHQVAGGATWSDKHVQLTTAVTYALPETVKGNHSIPPSFGGGEADVKLGEVIAALEFGYRF